MKSLIPPIATFILLSTVSSGQEPCGMPGVSVSVSPPCAVALGEQITVTLTNNSAETIILPSNCVFQAVSPDTCSSTPVFAPLCLAVLTPIAPGGSASTSWSQTDSLGAQVSPGIYAFSINYFDSDFGMFSCCPTVEVCSSPSTPSMEVPRLGSPPNPSAFMPGVTTGPIVGDVWDPVIDHSSFLPTAVLDLVAITLAPTNVPIPPFGTFLCDIFTPPGLLVLVTNPNPGTPFSIPVPCNCDLIGISLCTQGASVGADGTAILLTNALDIIIGTP